MNNLLSLLAFTILAAACLHAQGNVTVNRYDNSVTGSNVHETTLNVSNVKGGGFGKLYSYFVDGAVYAQPLYMAALPIPGRGTHNVLYVATMNDKVYAFDADRKGPPLWMRDLTDELHGVTAVPVTDITNDNNLNLVGNAGIEGTPVIVPDAHALYLVARTRENGQYIQRLHKLDLRDGNDLTPPATIQASSPATAKDSINGSLSFDPKGGNQRPALVHVNGAIIIAWASHEDIRPYHGWIMAYDAVDLKQLGVLCMTPAGADGGVWQSGRPPVVDATGAVYFEVGNGTWNGQRDFGTSVIKLVLSKEGLSVADYFTPDDYALLNDKDADLGSTGPLLIPGTNTLICGSKNGILYVLTTGALGHLTPKDTAVAQKVAVNGGRVLAGPALWNGPGGPTLYLWSEADFLKAFRFNGSLLEPVPVAKGNVGSHGSPGGALAISADEKKPGTGIVWATLTNGKSADHGNAAGVLRAFDAQSLVELWNSERSPARDRLGTLVKFVPPLVVAGRVYIPNYDDAVNVYGMLQ